jgi:hypothetical protein
MTETIKSNAKRRLDLSSASTTNERKKVKNPYVKASKSASADVTEERSAAATLSSTITPEAGIEKFFVAKRGIRDAKPRTARTLVTPPKVDAWVRGQYDAEQGSAKQYGQQRRSLEFPSDDDDSDLYYRSDDNSRTNNVARESNMYEPCKIHSKLGYHHRGELPLDQGRLRAYRFIRNNFLIPRDVEADLHFGVHSGSCFEERVIRAYSLGLLKPKKESKRSGRSLLVCSFCGDQGHIRGRCSKLL